jgi:hypothetical protein
MPDASIKVNGKKFMWDGIVYESKKEAEDTMKKYKDDNFDVELKEEEEGKHLLYTRRVVTEIVVEGEAPP